MVTSQQQPSGTYTVAQAAERLGIGRDLAYDLVRRDEFPSAVIKLGRRVLVVKAALDRLLSGQEAAS